MTSVRHVDVESALIAVGLGRCHEHRLGWTTNDWLCLDAGSCTLGKNEGSTYSRWLGFVTAGAARYCFSGDFPCDRGTVDSGGPGNKADEPWLRQASVDVPRREREFVCMAYKSNVWKCPKQRALTSSAGVRRPGSMTAVRADKSRGCWCAKYGCIRPIGRPRNRVQVHAPLVREISLGHAPP